MKREIEEAIVKASQIYPTFHQKPYLDGGIFGYKLAIEKACEWLKEYIEWNDLCTLEDIEQFRKVMKGE